MGIYLRATALYLNNDLPTAVAIRRRFSNGDITENTVFAKPPNEISSLNDEVNVVLEIKQKQRRLTESERDEVVVKYGEGMTMIAVATEYGCHRTTIRNILKERGVVIRM
jgi:DNA-directed RNA polymerase specialized sigma24 family protein